MTLGTSSKDGASSLAPMTFADPGRGWFLDQFCKFRAAGRYCDVVVTACGRSFLAHKIVLAAASPYFDSIFRSDKVCREKVIVKCDDPRIVDIILDYMYTGNVVIDRGVVEELLKLSNNLMIIRLKHYCADYLERNLDAVCCLHIKVLATRYNLPPLANKCADFFAANLNACLVESTDVLVFGPNQIWALVDEHAQAIRLEVHLGLIIRWVSHAVRAREQHFEPMIARCQHLQQVPMEKLERILDFNPLFQQSERSLLALLRQMQTVGLPLSPEREAKLHELAQKYAPGATEGVSPPQDTPAIPPPLPPPQNDAGHVIFPEEETILDQGHVDVVGDGEHSCGGGPPPLSSSHHLSVSTAPAAATNAAPPSDDAGCGHPEGCAGNEHRQQSIAVSQLQQQHLQQQQQAGETAGGLRLCIRLAQIPPHERRQIGMKLYRKNVELAKRRRGRPPKQRLLLHGAVGVGDVGELAVGAEEEEPVSLFYNFDETQLPATVFYDEDELDPSQLNPEDMLHLLADSACGTPNAAGNGIAPQPVGPGIQAEYRCEHCLFTTNQSNHLRRHSLLEHERNVLYVCSLCQFECCWNKKFYSHMRQHFPGPLYQCDTCAYSSEKITVLLTHRLIHSDDKPYKCTECPFRCRIKGHLVLHHRGVHTDNRPYACQQCGRSFAAAQSFERHCVTHTGERPFHCGQCAFTTKYHSHLISHRRVHSGDLFRCEVRGCDYSSPKKSQLAAHLRTHMAIRCHKCRICHRSFVEKSHLVRHERIHLEEKPFKCEKCDYSSTRRDKLKDHILKHHDTDAAGVREHKRRNRRAKQLKQLAAVQQHQQHRQVPPLPPNSDTSFRPIAHDDYVLLQKRQLERQKQRDREQQALIIRRRDSEPSCPTGIVGAPAHISASTIMDQQQQQPTHLPIRQQQQQKFIDLEEMELVAAMEHHQQQHHDQQQQQLHQQQHIRHHDQQPQQQHLLLDEVQQARLPQQQQFVVSAAGGSNEMVVHHQQQQVAQPVPQPQQQHFLQQQDQHNPTQTSSSATAFYDQMFQQQQQLLAGAGIQGQQQQPQYPPRANTSLPFPQLADLDDVLGTTDSGRPPSWTFGADGCFFGPSGGGGQPTGAGALLSSTLRIAPEPYELVTPVPLQHHHQNHQQQQTQNSCANGLERAPSPTVSSDLFLEFFQPTTQQQQQQQQMLTHQQQQLLLQQQAQQQQRDQRPSSLPSHYAAVQQALASVRQQSEHRH